MFAQGSASYSGVAWDIGFPSTAGHDCTWVEPVSRALMPSLCYCLPRTGTLGLGPLRVSQHLS